MSNKKETDTEPNAEVKRPVSVTISKMHIDVPHSVELRVTDEGETVSAGLRAQNEIMTVGAKSVENIIRECGVEPPVGDEKCEISFSPYTGEVIAVTKK